MTKMPWFKCFPEKLLSAVSRLSTDEGYIYLIILLRIYDTGGPISDTPTVLARQTHMSVARAEKALASLIEQGKVVMMDGKISNPVAEVELGNRESRSEAAKKSAEERWGKSKGKQAPGDANASDPQSERNANKNLDNRKRKKDSRPAKQDEDGYPQDFEDLWRVYPRTRGTSKKKAYDLWRMMNDERRERVKAAVPIYAAQMKSEGRPEDKIQHMTTWLNGRVYETLAAPPVDAGNVVQLPWHKTASREQWQRVLQMYRDSHDWRDAWGPAPGKAGCSVPDDLVAELPDYLRSQSRGPGKPEADAV